jgi:hypothetical protein
LKATDFPIRHLLSSSMTTPAISFCQSKPQRTQSDASTSRPKTHFHIQRRSAQTEPNPHFLGRESTPQQSHNGQSRFHIVHFPHALDHAAGDDNNVEVFVSHLEKDTKEQRSTQTWIDDPLIDVFLR